MISSLYPLAQQLAPAQNPPSSWLPVALLILIALVFAVSNVAMSILIGPSRTGPGKEQAYESGMVPVGDAHKRFNVRFYIVAMIFLVFDVDIIFFYPWASIYAPSLLQGKPVGPLLIEMVIFIALLLVAYFYAWGKGVFRWD